MIFVICIFIARNNMQNTIRTTGNNPYSTAIVKNPLCEVVISSYWDKRKV